ncbi:DNA (cytosine-5)-methyltransferase 3B [Frankliniella occidentalis]|uniref:DNA (cytosine-5-)-methyltransferase n=1 Tax=Frankliniella occidentalis TaxID=133901 RepID=A0A6J1TFI8_FRAOC|nr:DNA (cytosine-5)-methyltransferase 3B [Frankliniella occidentalis]
MGRRRGVRRCLTKAPKGTRWYGAKKKGRQQKGVTPDSPIREQEEDGFRGFETSGPMQGDRPLLNCISLFDGISAAYVALTALGIRVGQYFTSEICEPCRRVQERHVPFGVQLGCIEQLTEDVLDSIQVPIHLCIGGSPCASLSRVNPARQGLHSGTGKLFFDFIRVKNYLLRRAEREGYPFYWCFENTKHLDAAVLSEMNRHLRESPVAVCSSEFSAMKRPRYFWGNLKSLSTPRVPGKCCLVLDDFLDHGRTALVKTLGTLTTNQESQRGPGGQLPVSERGVPSYLSITEIERLFGFPAHYTDTGLTSNSTRRAILGRSFCVPVVKVLLEELRLVFQINE